MSETNGGKVSGIIQVKNWQVFLILVSWLILSVANFVAMRADTTQNSHDIEEMKRDHVSKDRFDDLKAELLRRLQSIEDKLDQDRAIRSLH